MGSSARLNRSFLAIFVVALFGIAGIVGPRFIVRGSVSPITNAADFRAFYCAGRAIALKADPWRVEPLRACEGAMARDMGLAQVPDMVNPAPLPPFALALFAMLSAVTYPIAVCLWFATLVLATVATAVGVTRLTNLPFPVVALVVALSSIPALIDSQVAPLIVAIFVGSALLIASKRYVAAGALLTGSAIEPHIALPALLGAFLLVPRLRMSLVVSLATLSVVSVLGVGIGGCLEYLSAVLPLHATTEVHALQAQYSLTTVLTLRGVDERAAVRIGSVDYVAMTILGIGLARGVVLATKREWLAVFVPAATAMLGGVYVHLYQLAVVVVAALLIADASRGLPRSFGIVAIAGVLLSMISDTAMAVSSSDSFSGVLTRQLHSLRPDQFASLAARYWHDAHSPENPNTIREIVAFKLPALIGLFAFISAAALLRQASRGAYIYARMMRRA